MIWLDHRLIDDFKIIIDLEFFRNMPQQRRQTANKRKAVYRKQGPSPWMVIAIIAIIFSVGLVLKISLVPSQGSSNRGVSVRRSVQSQPWDTTLDSREVLQVASKFKCACGGCGELPLDECHCQMPRGAKEEKTFIRDKLALGLTVAEVADLVETRYGLRVKQ